MREALASEHVQASLAERLKVSRGAMSMQYSCAEGAQCIDDHMQASLTEWLNCSRG